jgi:Tfp pilus assembly pilus retraction ATPase PilT
MIIKLELVIIDDKKNKKIKKNIVQKFSYNTNSNRFKLNQYEKEIEEMLINKIVDETIKHISKF